MEASFFRDVNNIDIHNGKFIMKTAPDNSRRTVNHHHATTFNDRSRHTTNYGGYKNYGQHAEGRGQINNYSAQTTNNGAVYGYRQYAPSNVPFQNPAPNDWTPSSSDDDYINEEPQPPARRQNPYWQQGPGDRDYSGSNEPRLGSTLHLTSFIRLPPLSNLLITDKRAKEAGPLRGKKERPNLPKKDFDQESAQFRREYETMSPEMKAYLRTLGFDREPEDSLDEEMANVSLDDRPAQRTRSPGSFGRHTPDVVPQLRKGKNAAHRSAPDDSDDSDEPDEADSDSGNGGALYSSSYTHNDNRVVTKHINSHNVNTENVVDSYNDNSTRTEIKKNAAR
jgi:hypothetical protein